MPLLRTMYIAASSENFYHIDQLLIISVIFLLLSEDKGFCSSMQKKVCYFSYINLIIIIINFSLL